MVRPLWTHAAGADGGAIASMDGPNGPDEGLEILEGKGSNEEEQKPVRVSGRQKSADGLVANPDLLIIPGVGPRNLRKLVDNGIQGVAELKELYKNKVKFFLLPSRLFV